MGIRRNIKLKQGLPFVAVASALVALACLIALSSERQALIVDTGETRRSVETTLAPILVSQPPAVDDAAFREAISRLRDAPYVAIMWLFSPDGRVLEGSRAFSQKTVGASATDETQRILAALPDDALSAGQRTVLLAASVMQAEGEHNDVYRHLLREVHGPDGGTVAYVGVTYDVSPVIGASPGIAWILSLASLVVGMGTFWLSLPLWVWLDARARGERAWVWAAFVLIGNLVALMAYILARQPPLPAIPDSPSLA